MECKWTQKRVPRGPTGSNNGVQWGATGCNGVQRGATGCNGVQRGATGCNGVQLAPREDTALDAVADYGGSKGRGRGRARGRGQG